MTSQIRRAASSIPANIAEGWGRQGTKEFPQYLRISQGSLRELETPLLLSQRIGLCSEEEARPLLAEAEILSKQLVNLMRNLDRRKT